MSVQTKLPCHDTLRAVEWTEGSVRLLDQRLLPQRCEYRLFNTAVKIAHAIQHMVVRGAPAIGITAAYGVVLAVREAYARSASNWREAMKPDLELPLQWQSEELAAQLLQSLLQTLIDSMTDDEEPVIAAGLPDLSGHGVVLVGPGDQRADINDR